MDPVGVGLEGEEEFRGAHQESGDVEGAARDREADFVAEALDARAGALEPVEHEGQQAVGDRVRLGQVVDLGDVANDLFGKRKLVFVEEAFGAKSRGLGAHAELGPEAGQEKELGEGLDGLAVGLEPEALVGEIVQDVAAGPVGQPGAIDDEPGGRVREGFALDHRQELGPLAVSHVPPSIAQFDVTVENNRVPRRSYRGSGTGKVRPLCGDRLGCGLAALRFF